VLPRRLDILLRRIKPCDDRGEARQRLRDQATPAAHIEEPQSLERP
jgi:hypothetical protein